MKVEITKEELKDFEIRHYEGEIVLVEDLQSLSDCIETVSKAEVLGFDTESKPSFKKGQQNVMALLQMATTTQVFLIRVNKIGFPPVLVNFFNSFRGTIVGIGLSDDWREIRRMGIAIQPRFVVDLNNLALEKGFRSIGAKKLTAMLLGFTISKKQQISNWEAEPLSEAQILYAATDAWICRDIYFKLTLFNGSL